MPVFIFVKDVVMAGATVDMFHHRAWISSKYRMRFRDICGCRKQAGVDHILSVVIPPTAVSEEASVLVNTGIEHMGGALGCADWVFFASRCTARRFKCTAILTALETTDARRRHVLSSLGRS
jgi:hypothetical protein